MEANPGRFGDVVSRHRNSEGELATIERSLAANPEYRGKLLLCFYDESNPVVAPMLLDEGTVSWLRENLPPVCKHERASFDHMADETRQVFRCDSCGWLHRCEVDPVTKDIVNVDAETGAVVPHT